jgi:hypothetical protein
MFSDRREHASNRGVSGLKVELITHMRRHRAIKWLLIVGILIAATTSCASEPWAITPGHPQLMVLVSSGCPATLGGAQDVVNSYSGNEMVPPDPVSGLICRYRARLSQPGASGAPGALYSSVALAKNGAVHLATVIDSISTLAPQGSYSCPPDDESASIITFAYSGGIDVALWFSDSGCQTLDNGRIGAREGGNPRFYNTFLALMGELAPQQNP